MYDDADEIDLFLAELKKMLAKKFPKTVEEWDPDWLDKHLAVLEWKEKTPVERTLIRQMAIDNKKVNKPH